MIVDGMVLICFSFLLNEQVWIWYIIIIIYHFNYNLIPEINHVSRVPSVVAILWLQFMVHVMQFPVINVLYFYISSLQRVCTVPNMTLFCRSIMSCFPGILLRYFLNDFEIVPVVPYYYWYHFCFYLALTIILIITYNVVYEAQWHALLNGINE